MVIYLCICKFLFIFFSVDGNEYVSVDDFVILKMNFEWDYCKINKKNYYYYYFCNGYFIISISNFVFF